MGCGPFKEGMIMTYRITPHSDELCHYGVLGMRWGVRRYQNYDGTRIGTGGTPVINKAKTAEGSVKKLKGTMDKAFNNTVPGGQGGKAKGNARFAAIANPKIGKTLKNAKFAAAAGEAKPNSSKEKDNSKDNSQQIKNDVRGAKNDANSLTEASKKLTNIGKKHDPKIKQVGEKASRDAKKMSDQELRETINRIKMEREYQSLKESEVSSGWDKANDILDIVGTVVLIAGNIASLYLAYKSLKHDDADIPYAEVELYNYMIENNFDEEVIQHFMAMDDEYVDDFLEHYGVLGMKWGVRRYQNYDGTRIGTGSDPVTKTGDRIARKKSEQKSSTKAFDKKISRLERTGADPSRIDRKRAERDQVDRAYNKKISRLESKQVAEQKTIEDRIARKKAERDQAIKPFDNKISRLERNGADKDRIDRKKDEREQVAKSFDKKIDSLVKKYENVKLDQLAASSKKQKVRSEPEGYSLKRQLKEDSLRQEIKKTNPLSSTHLEKRKELNSYKRESKRKAEEYAQYEKDTYKKTGSLRNYTPEEIDGKRTGNWVNRRTGQVITQKEYNLAGNYETLPIHRKLRLK